MTIGEAKQLLPIIQAYSEGKEIEGLYKGTKSPWFKIKDMDLNGGIIFRIKPGSEYRPFANAEECWQEMQKHQPFGWVKEKERNVRTEINYIHNEGVMFSCGSVLFERMFDIYTFADGVPFGVKLEE